MASVEITTPVGRLVQGSLYVPQTTDMDGKPLEYKTGANKGMPRVTYFVALAIKKGNEQHWAQTEWGALIYGIGAAANPKEHNAPAYAWKITDGDDNNEFNSQGKPRKIKPCERDGYPGHWVLSFASSYMPGLYTLVNERQPKELNEIDANGELKRVINLGDYVQIFATANSNGSTTTPGIFLNPQMVCLIAYGDRIFTGKDVNDVGFGTTTLPEGASLTPKSSGAFAPPVAVVAPVTTYAPPAQVTPPPVVQPYPQILNAAPTALAPPPAAPVARMLKVHPQYNPTGAVSYDDAINAGWTDATLAQHGLI